MRLNKIKIAGFKSFVDPTTIDLRSNLTGIVGPNGCGKSNTIDAVRWVMGESSAKHLRGASMDDVIFNGSSARKPIGQASIELLFDNSDHSLGGEYARFAEIGIKRLISRDGQSKYFLNGSRCRRRDITDIFLGTGLGPRSYAIIEQGMISRLIEAKPEELRNTLEEAAGISRYKERRRETENRIRHTRENLDRLSDLREELEKQLAHLDRQAKAAERFKLLKGQERRLSAELLLLRLQQVRADKTRQLDIINETANRHQAELAEQRSLENRIETERADHVTANDSLNRVQADFYQIGAEISRIEQTIQHQKELETRFKRDLQQLEEELESVNRHANDDKQQLSQAENQLHQLEPEYEQRQEAQQHAEQQLERAEQQLADWQLRWSDLQQRVAQPTQQAQVERARMDQLENELQHIADRLGRMQKDQGVFNTEAYHKELEQQESELETVQAKHLKAGQTYEQQKRALEAEHEKNRELQEALQNDRASLQSLTGRLASLEALQQAGLGKGSGGKLRKQFNAWLNRHQLEKQPRLAELIQVESGWEKALETVLGNDLEAISLDDSTSSALQDVLADLPDVSASFFMDADSKPDDDEPLSADSLASKVSRPAGLKSRLASVFCAEDLQEAWGMRAALKNGQSVVTRDGLQLGRNWLRLTGRDQNNQREGVLARQQEIEQIQRDSSTLQHAIKEHQATLETGQASLKRQEESLGELQSSLNELYREEARTQSRIDATRNRISQTEANQQRLLNEIEELTARQLSEQEAHQSATRLRNQALLQMESLEKEKTNLQAEQQPLQEAVNQARQSNQELRHRVQQLQLQLESQRNTRDNTRIQLERFSARLTGLEERKQKLLEQRSGETFEPSETLQQQLETHLQQRKQTDRELGEARETLQGIDNRIRELEQKRHLAEQAVDKYRNRLESLKLELQEVSVREQTLKERLDETEFDEETLLEALDSEATLKAHQQSLEQVQQKISRLGAINLAAIEEFKTQSERKIYLDQQNDDLEEALGTLESAIARIDRDTRNLFKDTFEKVNIRIQEMFPQLFGGGKAHLEMTGEDLLTTGIAIMAQPPGKRISSIHLMSGGEKALTAVAMVFAIFELNPAPFCMLDEVDAPLDEANVGRFCELVRKMSERVQFIFITHNKTTMELADNLVGVTMREPGVSRLVSVDVNEAARMAQE